MSLVVTVLIIFALLVASELWWRHKRPRDEFSRKFIHICVGTLVAFAPLYMSWLQIGILSAGFIAVVLVSKYFRIFQSIHAVERPTWGEVFFAAAVGILAYVTHNPWIYTIALLHMSLADGMAAVVGVTWGKETRYKVLGHAKSVVGSLTFFVISVLLLLLFNQQGGDLALSTILLVAAGATAMENFGVHGLDNLFVPLAVGFVLGRLG